jgi:hypothetical protein
MTTTRPSQALMTAFIAIAAVVFAIAAAPLMHIAASVVA